MSPSVVGPQNASKKFVGQVKVAWTYWGGVLGQLRPALAAQHRLGKRRRGPNPVQVVGRVEAHGVA